MNDEARDPVNFQQQPPWPPEVPRITSHEAEILAVTREIECLVQRRKLAWSVQDNARRALKHAETAYAEASLHEDQARNTLHSLLGLQFG